MAIQTSQARKEESEALLELFAELCEVTPLPLKKTVENWHSVLRPFIAVHCSLSADMLAILAIWHNHWIASRGLYKGLSPLIRSGLAKESTDWLVALGSPSASPSCRQQSCSILSREPEMESIAA